MFYIKRLLLRLVMTLIIMAAVYFIRQESVSAIPTYLLVMGIFGVLAGSFPYWYSPSTVTSREAVSRGMSIDLLFFNKDNIENRNPKAVPPIGVIGVLYITAYWVLVNFVM